MTRRRTTGRQKGTLGALALGLSAVALTLGSGADFTARTASPGNTFSAGSLSMDNTNDGAAIFTATDMRPGADPLIGVIDIKNTGTIDGAFTVSRDQLTNSDGGEPNPTPFATKVFIGIVDCGKFRVDNGPYGPDIVTPVCGDSDDNPLFHGPLSHEDSALDLGTFLPGDKHRYQFSAQLDGSAGNEYAGDGSSARYVFDAVQGR